MTYDHLTGGPPVLRCFKFYEAPNFTKVYNLVGTAELYIHFLTPQPSGCKNESSLATVPLPAVEKKDH